MANYDVSNVDKYRSGVVSKRLEYGLPGIQLTRFCHLIEIEMGRFAIPYIEWHPFRASSKRKVLNIKDVISKRLT